MPNDYSDAWFEIFLSTVDPLQSKSEVNFLLQQVKTHHLQSVLDIACGLGRHSSLLANFGLDVTGIDINADLLFKARRDHPTVEFIQLDMRELHQLDRKFDLILSLWQSFGFYSDEVNRGILEQIREILQDRGRFIIDIYNYDFFARKQGTRILKRANKEITETKFVKDNRLTVQLDYPDNMEPDIFNWRIYRKHEFIQLMSEIGFKVEVVATGYDYTRTPTREDPRIQYIFSKVL